jgi:hypothetical protein
MKFLLEMMRLLHAVLGITPAEPEHERFYLFIWIGTFTLILVIVAVFVVVFTPHIMR